MMPYKKKEVCIIIPVYKDKLSINEEKSMWNTIEKMRNCDIYFITYFGSHVKYYKKFKNIKYAYFPHKYFKGTDSYNDLMLNVNFYLRFIKYRYMLICQTDAYILGNYQDLLYYVKTGYSYYGAPWVEPMTGRYLYFKRKYLFLQKSNLVYDSLQNLVVQCYVGNGGLSLRDIDKTIKLLLSKWFVAKIWGVNEDGFFAYHGLRNHVGYTVATVEIASGFAQEVLARKTIRDGHPPFGVHAWEKFYPELLKDVRK